MKFSAQRKFLTSILMLIMFFSADLISQTYNFRNFGSESNITSGFVYTINQSDDGFLWLGTGNGIARFDGFNFFPVPYPDSASLRNTTVSLKDKNGTIWFGSNDGSVFCAKNTGLTAVPLENLTSISVILQGPDGLIYIVPQGKAIFAINPEDSKKVKKYYFPDEPVIWSAIFNADGKLLVGTQENILVCSLQNDSISVVERIEGFDYSTVTSIHSTGAGNYIVGTDGNGLFSLKESGEGYELKRFRNKPEWESLSIKAITEDKDKSIWISTFGSGVIQVEFAEDHESVRSVHNYAIQNGLTANDVKVVFQDFEGNYWMGFLGEGISILESYAFGYYVPGKNPVENNIIYVAALNDEFILGTPSGYHLFNADSGESRAFIDLSRQVGKKAVTSYCLDKDKNLWIGTEGNGLFLRNNAGNTRLFFRSGDSGADFIKDIVVTDQNIWLATTNGVIVLDKRNGHEEKRFDINNGLPHNSISKIMAGKDGSIYIGTESDRLYIVDEKLELMSGEGVMQGSTMNKILSFTRDGNGAIWSATLGNGVFKNFNDSVSSLTRANDLMSNYCYSILSDSDNDIWVGHEKGFSRFDQSAGIMKVFGTGFAKGGVCNTNAMFESSAHKVFIGTTEGLIIYDKRKDRKQNMAPYTNINSITINDIVYPYQQSFTLPYSKRNVIRINYSGISFSEPDKVFFSTYLENYDDDWTRLISSREVSYNLSDGKYKFNLISVNRDGLSQENPVSLEIVIKAPFWRAWWFILASLLAFAGSVFLIIRERDKSQKKIQEYLEKELEIRTSVVIKQKGEIELQNIAITDSINYAKRIQSSILPDIAKLKDSFRDAFILFHPRDIVSGDFYWFDKIDDDKFVLVCADSTGHGVPGAFMSMIGSTLLQDIVTRKRITKPSEVLKMLDNQIFSTLNQNVELGVSNDGMDMVVCEFNIRTRHIRFASAMRPVIIVLDGESYYIKGNRSSVGGESAIEKYYDDQEYYLGEGDTVYLFSDGLPDQFGGIDGKKLKIARLKKMIEQVSKLPMEEQKEALAKFFFDWKGSFDQVDDVLLIGVKV